MINKWYDSDKDVLASQGSLDDFVRLVEERHEAGYERRERLKEFLVFDGKYRLDSCGNVWKRTSEFTFSMRSDLPLPNLECKGCGDGWTIENIDDTVVRSDTQVIPLTHFVGQTLTEVKTHYLNLTDAIYRMQPDILVRNDKHIDLSPKYPNAKKDWEKGIVNNEWGWLAERDGVTNTYVIQDGDEGFFNVGTYFHRACNRADLEATYRERFRKVFEAAGFDNVKLTATTNRYSQGDHDAPWYNVDTGNGKILIGWRKRVINIDWSKMKVKGAAELFQDEEVTKNPSSIHAWGWDKATEYLSRLRSALK